MSNPANALGGLRDVQTDRRTAGPRSIVIPGLRASPDALPASPSPWDIEFAQGMRPGYKLLNSGPSTWDINKTVPGCLYLQQNASVDSNWHAILWPAPPVPFTVIMKQASGVYTPTAAANSQQPGLMLTTATPSQSTLMDVSLVTAGDGTTNMLFQEYNTSTGSVNSTTTPAFGLARPLWYRLVVTSSTSIAASFSFDGLLFTALATGINPGFTVGSVGPYIRVTNNTACSIAVAYMRFTRP